MDLGIVSIGSSSSGNAYLITSGRTNLLLDVGLSAKRIKSALEQIGVPASVIQGIFITHEHIDHVRSVRAMAAACDCADIFASRGTVYSCERFEHVDKSRIKYMKAQDMVTVGDIGIKSFGLSHDASEPISYTFMCGDTRLSVVTDTGVVTDEIFDEINRADMLILEANHETNILKMGDYPYSIKRRILSDEGHLSNVAAGDALVGMLEKRKNRSKNSAAQIVLAHLSSENNTPIQAELTVSSILKEYEFSRGKDFELGIADKNNVGDMVTV